MGQGSLRSGSDTADVNGPQGVSATRNHTPGSRGAAQAVGWPFQQSNLVPQTLTLCISPFVIPVFAPSRASLLLAKGLVWLPHCFLSLSPGREGAFSPDIPLPPPETFP